MVGPSRRPLTSPRSRPHDDLSSSPVSEKPCTKNQTCDDDLLSGQLIGLRSRIVSERELFCSDSERTKA